MTRKSPTRMPFSWHLHRALSNRFRRNAAVGGAERPPGTCHQHGRVLVTTTVTPVGTLLGLIPAVQGGVPLWGLLWCPLPGGKWGERGWLVPSASRAERGDTQHRGTVTPQAGMWLEGSSAGQGRQGKLCLRAELLALLPDVGWVPLGHPGRFWGHCPHAAPSATVCPAHSLGPSLLLWGCQGHVRGDTTWGLQHQEMAQTGHHKRAHRCPSACAGETPMATAGLCPSDGTTTGWPGGCPLCPIPVPTMTIMLALMGYSPAPQAGSRAGGNSRIFGGNNRKMPGNNRRMHSPVQHLSTGYWQCWDDGDQRGKRGREVQGVTVVTLVAVPARRVWGQGQAVGTG